jgi:low affinity Fe/Cu permease
MAVIYKGIDMKNLFRKFAGKVAELSGSPVTFMLAAAVIIVWLLLGPIFKYSDSWQLIINTGTTIITFLMVFLIQNVQNRDAKAIHLKLDELIRSVKGARNSLVDLEDMTDEELEELQKQFAQLHKQYSDRLKNRKKSHRG